MMNKPYAVVIFTDNSSLEFESASEIPSCWLTSDQTQCWWPNTKNVGPHISKKSKPDKKWQLHNITYVGFYGKFLIIA